MNFRRSHILLLVEISLLYLCTSVAAWGQQGPELVQPATSTRGPSDPIRIHLTNIPGKALQFLALEVDEIDVTSMVTMEGDVVIYTPPQPLAYGEHQLRLVEHSPDGNINELGEWSFELRKSALFRDASLNGSITVNGGYRTSIHGIAEPLPPRDQFDGNGQFAGSAQNENWSLNGALSIIANNQSRLMPRQEGHFDIGQFMIAADSGLYGLKAGDQQQVGPDNFVVQGFNRRGISVSAAAPGDKASITAFSMHTTPITGAVNILGVADSDNVVNGVLATIKPIPGNLDALAVVGTYVDGGSNGQTSTSVVGGPGSGSGRADSLILDSSLLQKRLRLRGEYATSNYDFDGSAGPIAPLSGHAYSGLVTYIPFQDLMLSNQFMVLNFGLEKKLISTYFRSPSNPGGASDSDMSHVFAGLNWNGLNVQVNAGKQTDNVDNNPLIPEDETQLRNGVINYSPQLSMSAQSSALPSLPWYGVPSLNASFMSLNKEIVQINGAPYNDPTHSTYTRVAGANFQYSTWNWNITQTWMSDQGYTTDPTPHTNTDSTNLQGNFRFFEKLTVGLNASSQNNKNIGSGINTNGITNGLNLAYPFTDKINTNVTYSVQHNWATDGSNDTVTSSTNAFLNWVVDTPHGVNPGVTLGMNGSYQDVKNNTSSGQTASNLYQVFLKLSLSWAPML